MSVNDELCFYQIFDKGFDRNCITEEAGGYEKYLEKMSMSGTWGDHPVLIAASALYERRLIVVPNEGQSISVVARNVPPTADKLFLGYYVLAEHKRHYMSLTPKYI